MSALAPGSTIGILGGGQLGRMLAAAAARLGLDAHIYTPEPDSPAARVAARATVASFDDPAALLDFARGVDVVTTEFENVPANAAAALVEAGAKVRPNPAALAVAQDRIEEKRLFARLGIETAPYAPVTTREELDAALDHVGMPAILKTRRLGYDGKGQARIFAHIDIHQAFAVMNGAPSILEGFCAFKREISIVAARGVDGRLAAYDLVENEHRNGVLARTSAPAAASAEVQARAREAAHLVAYALDYVGVFAIEFFEMGDGRLIANEMAPRVHNTGHWTMDACLTSQFEQHIRAISGWPLGSTRRIADAVMVNLIGAEAAGWEALVADPEARVHLYGKRDIVPGRKMGHVTRLKPKT